MIVLVGDFGLQRPYTGQMKAVLRQMARGVPLIDFLSDAQVGIREHLPICLRPTQPGFRQTQFFAPVAARLACGVSPPGRSRDASADRPADRPDDHSEIVYIDHFGNATTGLRLP